MKKFFTTGDVAKICEISPKTVINYCESGKLSSEKSPVTNYRRIPRDALVAFMEKYNIPVSRADSIEQKSVLVVDDDENFVRLLKKAFNLAEKNVLVKVACDGYEALVEIGKEAPDLVILDVMMPKIDGYEVCKTLRSNPSFKGVKICAISGVSDDDMEKNLLRCGADLFIKKPFEFREFVKTTTRLLGLNGGADDPKTR